MDSVQTQINLINTKIDTLHEAVDQLGSNLVEALSDLKQDSNSGMSRSMFGTTSRYSYTHARTPDASLEHKDVLVDNTGDFNTHSGEKILAPEVQIQRLTAQLTAAYNRIAALEEQLLAQRVH